MMEQWTCSSLNAGKNYQKSVVLSHLATGTGISKCESDLKHEAEPSSDYALYPALDATVSPRSRPDRARRLYLWFSESHLCALARGTRGRLSWRCERGGKDQKAVASGEELRHAEVYDRKAR